jgi:hypothetical protein
MPRQVVLVGHCGVDGPRLQSELSRLDDVEVTRVNSEADLENCCDDADLLLVNREPVGFDEDGLAIVRHICQNHPDAKVMLVSDLPDAQAEAEKAGALPGFGKRLMGTPKLQEAVLNGLKD